MEIHLFQPPQRASGSCPAKKIDRCDPHHDRKISTDLLYIGITGGKKRVKNYRGKHKHFKRTQIGDQSDAWHRRRCYGDSWQPDSWQHRQSSAPLQRKRHMKVSYGSPLRVLYMSAFSFSTVKLTNGHWQ